MTSLSVSADLGAAAEALGTAIGLLRPGASGLELDGDFFAAPGDRLASVLADPDQRAGTLAALELLAPSEAVDGVAHHRLLGTEGVTVSITTQDSAAQLVVGVALTLSGGAGEVTLAVPLLAAAGSSVSAVMGTAEHPVTVALTTSASDGAALGVQALLAGPDLATESRVVITVAPDNAEPLVLDPAADAPLGDAVRALVQVALAGSVPEPAGSHLAGVLGLVEGIPPLPLAPAGDGSSAWRSWLAALATPAGDGNAPVLAWAEHLLALLDGTAMPPGAAAPTAGAPLDLTLRRPAGTAPGLGLRFGLVDGAAGTGRATATVRCWFDAPDGQLTAEAALAEIPLAGHAPSTVAASCSVTAQAPAADGARLWPPDGTEDPTLRVGRLIAGLGLGPDGTTPVLALDDVHLALPGSAAIDVAHLDLTSADALAESVAGALADIVVDGLGSSTIATALLRLLGLTPPPGVPAVDAAALATDPLRALAEWYAVLHAAPSGWASVAGCAWVLLGGAPPGGDLDAITVTGSGTPADPWQVALDHLPLPAAGSVLGPLMLCVWDGGAPGGPPRLCLGLRLAATSLLTPGAPPVAADLLVELFGVDVTPLGAGAPRLLSSLMAGARLTPGVLSPLGDTAVDVGPVGVTVTWEAGSPLRMSTAASGVRVTSPAGDVALAGIAFPGSAPTTTEPDLGLAGGDAGGLWAVALALVGVAGSALGGVGRLATVVAGTPDGTQAGLPPLALPDPDDVRSGLGDLAGLVGGWVAGMVVDASGVDPLGRPRLLSVLSWLQGLLTRRVRAAPGREPDPAADGIGGSGTASTPWSTPLQEAGEPAVELLTWVSGDGPPGQWSGPALQLMLAHEQEPETVALADADEPDETEVEDEEGEAEQVEEPVPPAAAFHVPDGVDVLAAARTLAAAGGVDPRALTPLTGGLVDALAEVLCDADGIVGGTAALPPAGWGLADPVAASHWDLVAHPVAVAQAAEHVRACTADVGPTAWTLVAVDAGLTDTGDWAPLAASLGLGLPQALSLRVPGVDPALVDLGGLTAASAYVVDLGEAATSSSADLAGRLGHAVDGVRAARGVDPIVFVAHSWGGLVARDRTRADPAGVLGLVTLGTPYADPTLTDASTSTGSTPGIVSAPAAVLTDPDLADVVHALRTLLPDRSALGPHGFALGRLADTLDGWRTASPGEAPVQLEPLVAALARADEERPPLPGVPALAVRGALPGDLRTSLRTALWRIGPGGSAPGGPEHGVRVGLDLGPAVEGEATVDLTLRLDTAADTAALEVRAEVGGPGAWLVGGPGDGRPQPARIRRAELLARLEPGGDNRPVVHVDLAMHDTGQSGTSLPVVGLADPTGPALAASVLAVLGVQAGLGGRVGALVELLSELGLVGGEGVELALLPDGIATLEQDSAGAFADLLTVLLDRPTGAAGLLRDDGSRAGAGPWRYHHPRMPVELVITPDEVTVITTGDGLPAGQDGWLAGTARVALPVPAGRVGFTLTTRDSVLSVDEDTGDVDVQTPDLDPPATLVPPDPDLLDRLAGPAARSLAAAALGTALGAARGGRSPMPWLGGFLRDPGTDLARRLGADGTGPPDPALVGALLAEVAGLVGSAGPPDRPLLLPGGLGLYARRSGRDGLRLGLTGEGPVVLAGQGAAATTLDVDLWLDVDATRTSSPGGTVRLHLPLAGAPWGSLDLELGTGPGGATLAVTPSALGATIGLLPTVSGLEVLAGSGARLLLAAVLDTLVARLRDRPGGSPALDVALEVAAAFGIYDPVTVTFDSDRLTTLAADLGGAPPDTATARRRAAALAATAGLLAPGAEITTAGGSVALATDLAEGGSLAVDVDLMTAPTGIAVGLAGATAGAVTLDADVSAAGGSLSLAAAVELGRAVVLTPAFSAEAPPSGGAVTATLRPLGDDTVVLPIAPRTVAPTADQRDRLATHLALPVVVLAALDGLGTTVEDPLWAGGSSAADLLVAAGLARRRGASLDVAETPALREVLSGSLGLLAGSGVPVGGGVELVLAEDGTRYGPALQGSFALPDIGPPVTLHLGMPAEVETGWDGGDTGLAVLLVNVPASGDPVLAPLLRLDGVGLLVAGEGAAPLVDTPVLAIGQVGLYGQVDIDLEDRVRATTPVHGALQLLALGLPLIPSETGDNPVAASLLSSTGGDQTPASPPVDVTLASGESGWTVRFAGEATLRLPVQEGFGPLYLDEVALSYETAEHRVGVGVSGEISVGPLVVGLDDLTVRVPLLSAGDLGSWLVDLAGLAVSLASEVVTVSGGLKKLPLPGGDVEYLGALSITVAGRNLTAVGSYAQPHDELGEFTSLFVFLSVPVPLGGPPFFFVLGLAAGIGYNRLLLVPDDPIEVPSFPLVAAVSGDLQFGDDPVAGLRAIGADLPPSRGGYWGAFGVRFTTFGLIQGTALAYVSLDTGVEVGLLGLLQLALPPGGGTVLSVELGLAASYSTVDQLISVRAALTEGSWLFSQDCRLTGGFAFMAWLATPEVLLSIGGYHPAFIVPDHYPAVDPVGFAWTPAAGVSVKGESYFALTHSAAMVGGSLEASYDLGPVRAWFETSVDVMVTWDPFSYRADLHIGVGASLEVEACLFVCVRARLSVDVGADLHIAGPSLRAVASVDLGVITITVAFGTESPQPWLTWEEVSRTYLGGGSSTQPATVTSVTSGRLETAEATAPDGSEAQPWLVGTTFSLTTGSAMPCTALRVERSSAGEHLPSGIVAPPDLDVVPAGPTLDPVEAVLAVDLSKRTVTGWEAAATAVVDSLDLTGTQGHYPCALWEQGIDDDPAAPMLAALEGATLVAAISVAEVTGALGDQASVPLSTLVEEQPVLPLPLGEPQGAGTGSGGPVWPGEIELPGTGPILGRRHGNAPRRLGVGPPRAHRRGTPWSGAPTAAAGPATALLPGAAALWDVRGLRLDDLVLDGIHGAVRVVALAAGGAPLADLRLPASDGAGLGALLPPGTARLAVVSEPDAETAPRAAGWRLRDDLVQVGRGTLLAGDAVLLTTAPVRPSGRYALAGRVAWLPASAALAGQLVTTTVVPGPGDVVVVQYGRVGRRRADPVVPSIEVRGAEAGTGQSVPAAGSTLMVLPVRRRDEPLRVRVSGAGVTAVTVVEGGAPAWLERLSGRPRVPRPGAVHPEGAGAVQVQLRLRPSARRSA